MSDNEREELEELRREMHLNSLGDRPHSMAASRLRRMAFLEALDIEDRVDRQMTARNTADRQYWEQK